MIIENIFRKFTENLHFHESLLWGLGVRALLESEILFPLSVFFH